MEDVNDPNETASVVEIGPYFRNLSLSSSNVFGPILFEVVFETTTTRVGQFSTLHKNISHPDLHL